MAIQRWEMLLSAQTDCYLLKIQGDRQDVDRILLAHPKTCQTVQEIAGDIFKWVIFVVDAPLSERLAIQNQVMSLTTDTAGTKPSEELLDVLDGLSGALQDLTNLTDDEQAFVMNKMARMGNPMSPPETPPPVKGGPHSPVMPQNPYPPAGTPLPRVTFPGQPGSPTGPKMPSAPSPIPMNPRNPGVGTPLPSPGPLPGIVRPVQPPRSFPGAPNMPGPLPSIPLPKMAPPPHAPPKSAPEGVHAPPSVPMPIPQVEPPLPQQVPPPTLTPSSTDKKEQIPSVLPKPAIEVPPTPPGTKEQPKEITAPVQDLKPEPAKPKDPTLVIEPLATTPKDPMPVNPPVASTSKETTLDIEPLASTSKEPPLIIEPPASTTKELELVIEPLAATQSPPPPESVPQASTGASPAPKPDDGSIIRISVFYPSGQDQAKDQFMNTLIDVAQKKSKRPTSFHVALSIPTVIAVENSTEWIWKAKTSGSDIFFVILPEELGSESMDPLVGEALSAGLRCFLVPQIEIASKLLYMDLMVELMMFKRRVRATPT